MTEKKPKASVIIPIYNCEENLRESLDSVLAQTMNDFEVVCVDDGATDGSPAILEEYAQKDDRIRIVHQENQGAGAARNEGFRQARGEYVFFCDSDDLCAPGLLEETVAIADREAADIVCFNFDRFNVDGQCAERKGYHPEWLPEGATVFNYQICPDRILSVVNPTPWNKLFRREFIQENDLKYEEISSTDDITFAAVSVAKAKRVAVCSKTLYSYRIGHSNTISSTKAKKLYNVIAAVEGVVRQVRELPYFETIRHSLQRFEADNYVFAMINYVKDLRAPGAEAFYTHVHNRFHAEEFADFSLQHAGYKKLYDAYRIIKCNPYEAICENTKRRLIVSLTSYPVRMKGMRQVLDTIYAQSKKPDGVVLWLAQEQFPRKELELPYSIMELVLKEKLVVRWCDDLKAHKKYFYALQEYRDDLVVTIDDDLLYHPKLLENLYISYLLHPDAVSTARAHLITLDEDGTVLPYEYWIKEYDGRIGVPSMQLLCTGGGGALYPSHLFSPELFDKQAIIDNCPLADDLWLKIMELAAGIPVVLSEEYMGLRYVPGSQVNTLCSTNVDEGQNDRQFEKSVAWAEGKYGQGMVQQMLSNSGIGVNLMTMKAVCEFLIKERARLSAKLKQAYVDKSRYGEELRRLKVQHEQVEPVRKAEAETPDPNAPRGIGILIKGVGRRLIPGRVKPFVKRQLLRIPHKTKVKIKRLIHW